MEQWPEPNSPVWPFPLPPHDWVQTRPVVQASLRQALDPQHECVDAAGRCASRLLRPLAPGSMSPQTLPNATL